MGLAVDKCIFFRLLSKWILLGASCNNGMVCVAVRLVNTLERRRPSRIRAQCVPFFSGERGICVVYMRLCSRKALCCTLSALGRGNKRVLCNMPTFFSMARILNQVVDIPKKI